MLREVRALGQGQAKMVAREFESRWSGAPGAGGKCGRAECVVFFEDKAPRLALELGPCTMASAEVVDGPQCPSVAAVTLGWVSLEAAGARNSSLHLHPGVESVILAWDSRSEAGPSP